MLTLGLLTLGLLTLGLLTLGLLTLWVVVGLGLGQLGGLGSIKAKILLVLDDFTKVLAQFLKHLLLGLGGLKFGKFLVNLLLGAVQRVDGRLLFVRRVFAFLKFFLGLVHLPAGLSESLGSFRRKIVGCLLGFLGFILHLALLGSLLLQFGLLVDIRLSLFVRLLCGLLGRLGGFL